jgi:quercetin dioxygenase-like cupin family protein
MNGDIMRVVTETPARTTPSASGSVAALAAPSQGSTELCNWRVRMNAGSSGPVHAIDREQLWAVLAGTLEFTVDGETIRVRPGETAILPAHQLRQATAGDSPVDAVVCMAAGGRARLPGSADAIPLPWAQ